MPSSSGLHLHEEVMLLALHDEKGTVTHSYYPYGIAGAVLAELLMAGRLGIEQVKRSRLVVVKDRTRVGEPLLDECLSKVVEAKRRSSLTVWASRFAATRRLKARVTDGLCARGILRKEEGRVMFVFPRNLYPSANSAPELETKTRLHRAIFGEGKVDERTAVLLALVHHTGILRKVFDRHELKERKRRIQEITSGQLAGTAVGEAIAAQVAMVAAGAAAVAAASSS